MAKIAQKCADIEVTVVDINPERIAAWESDELPVYEPGLLEVTKEARGRNLFFSTDVEAAIEASDIIFISVNSPTKTYGIGAGKAAEMAPSATSISNRARNWNPRASSSSAPTNASASSCRAVAGSARRKTETRTRLTPTGARAS